MASEPLLPSDDALSPSELLEESPRPIPGVPSKKAQSWGVVISIVVIVMMIIIGAFYAWGKRVSQTYPVPTMQNQ